MGRLLLLIGLSIGLAIGLVALNQETPERSATVDDESTPGFCVPCYNFHVTSKTENGAVIGYVVATDWMTREERLQFDLESHAPIEGPQSSFIELVPPAKEYENPLVAAAVVVKDVTALRSMAARQQLEYTASIWSNADPQCAKWDSASIRITVEDDPDEIDDAIEMHIMVRQLAATVRADNFADAAESIVRTDAATDGDIAWRAKQLKRIVDNVINLRSQACISAGQMLHDWSGRKYDCNRKHPDLLERAEEYRKYLTELQNDFPILSTAPPPHTRIREDLGLNKKR